MKIAIILFVIFLILIAAIVFLVYKTANLMNEILFRECFFWIVEKDTKIVFEDRVEEILLRVGDIIFNDHFDEISIIRKESRTPLCLQENDGKAVEEFLKISDCVRGLGFVEISNIVNNEIYFFNKKHHEYIGVLRTKFENTNFSFSKYNQHYDQLGTTFQTSRFWRKC